MNLNPINHLRNTYRVLKKYRNRFKYFFFFYLPNSRAIRKKRIIIKSPFHYSQKIIISGKGRVEIGENCQFGVKQGGYHKWGYCEFQPRYHNALIRFERGVITNNNLFFCAANYIEIGQDTLIGHNVEIKDHEAHGLSPEKRKTVGDIGKVIIGKNVWIGSNVTILKNTEIGDNTIIATGAVVSGIFPPNVVIGGVPAKIIKQIL